ncbi:MAG TPA: calcium/proton exchanger [Ktedonobacteraceae bacterium]|nr:calcium/proton exchanger [Ktedonobacteraceae bacterium]
MLLSRKVWFIIIGSLILTLGSAVLTITHGNAVITFAISGCALALLAALIGEATDQLGSRFGAGVAGVLQAGLGNIPELFVGIFSLRAGLVSIVQSALVGSILSNSLLVLGLAFFLGGIRHGKQQFSAKTAGMISTLILLSVAGLVIPTVVHTLHTPAAAHEESFGITTAIVLLIIFIASIPFSLKDDLNVEDASNGSSEKEGAKRPGLEPADEGPRWPLWLTIVLLATASLGAALVSNWFVATLEPAITVLHLSQAFTGLVIVAIAGNAVEHFVGIQFAMRNRMNYAVSIILNSSLQISLGLTPVLVLLSLFLGGAHLTLVFAPLLVVALILAALLIPLIIYDGISTWLEGLTLIGLYAIIAISFWWG